MTISTRLTALTGATAAALFLGVSLVTGSPSLVAETDAAYTDTAVAATKEIPASIPASAAPSRQVHAPDTNAAIVDGKVYLWGSFGYGSNGIGGGTAGAGTGAQQPPSVFASLADVVDLSGNITGFKALDASGNLWTWGSDGFGENGGQSGAVSAGWAPLDTGVVTMASSEYANVWLKEDGTVWSVGSRALGQRGTGWNLACANGNPRVAAAACAANQDDPAGGRNRPAAPAIPVQLTPTPVLFPSGAGRIVALGGTYEGFYAVDDAGRVFYWGRSYEGGAGLPTDKLITADRTLTGSFEAGNNSLFNFYFSTPLEVPALTSRVQAEGLAMIGGGQAWGGLLTQLGNLYTWGTNENNANGHERGATVYGPTLLLRNVASASFSFSAGRALMTDGTVQAWGARLAGGAFKLPNGTLNYTGRLAVVYNGALGPAVAVGGTKDTSSYSLADGSLWTWGENGAGAACNGTTFANCTGSVSDTGREVGAYVWPALHVAVPSS